MTKNFNPSRAPKDATQKQHSGPGGAASPIGGLFVPRISSLFSILGPSHRYERVRLSWFLAFPRLC